MIDSGDIEFLRAAGYTYLPAESPMLWTHLESRFTESRAVGSKFGQMSSAFIEELIAEGEAILVREIVETLRRTGRVERVTRVLSRPSRIGTSAVVPRAEVDSAHILSLVSGAGTVVEKVIRVVPTQANAIPCTNEFTVEGGLYPDGRTIGFFDVHPGNLLAQGRGDDANHVYLALEEEIRQLASEMRLKAEDLTTVTGAEGEAMAERAIKALS